MFSNEHIEQVLNGHVVDNNGDKIGKVGDVYNDDRTGNPSWVTVNTGLFGTSNTFIPLDDAQVDGDTIRVPFSKDKVKDAPRVDADRHLDADEERELYRYYGHDYDEGYAAAGTRGGDHGADGDAELVEREWKRRARHVGRDHCRDAVRFQQTLDDIGFDR